MLTKKVTDDDNFITLSASAQALYLHLTMSADDDGFCNQVSVSMFKAHASMDDLKALLDKKFILSFGSVVVLKHWRMANVIRKDRYTPTAFSEVAEQLKLKENGAYSLTSGCQLGNQMATKWQPNGNPGKDSIGKDSIGEDKERLGELANVFLSPSEKEKLIEKMGLNDFYYYLSNLDLYIEQKGDKYKSHYAAMLAWYRRDKKKKEEELAPKGDDPYKGLDLSQFDV